MLIDLDPETEKLLQHELDAGRFPDAAALLSVALKQLLEAHRLAVLRAELDHADEQIERGECVDYEDHSVLAKEIHERGLTKLASLRNIGTR